MKTLTRSQLKAIVALTAAAFSLGGCNIERTGSVDTDRAADERAAGQPDVKTVYIKASIKDSLGLPGEVIVLVTDVNGKSESSHEVLTAKASDGAYKQTVSYAPGVRLTIRVEVKPAKPLTGAFCSITDGSEYVEVGPITESWRAVCILTTRR